MARYLVLEKSFIHNRLVEAGVEIDYDGEAGPNLKALDAPKGSESPKGSDPAKPAKGSKTDALV